MKRLLLLLCVAMGAAFAVQAQDLTCVPDTSLPDEAIGVFPVPYSEANPTGGIFDTACYNTPFQFTFTVAVPDSFAIPGLGPVAIQHISIDPEQAVSNLPDGLDYVCNPPNCVFEQDAVGCILLYGTPTDEQDIGVHDLMITALVQSFIPLEITFPDTTFFNAGNYFLHIQEEGSPACNASSTFEPFANQLYLANRPNPTWGPTQIEVSSKLSGDFQFQVFSLLGEVVHREVINLLPGLNRIDYDASALPNGIYIYTFSDGLRAVSSKLVVQR